MKEKLTLIAAVLFIGIFSACFSSNRTEQQNDTTEEQPIEEAKHALEVPPLKDIYKDYFLIGSIVNPGDLGTSEASKERYAILKHHYNALTFENDMKPDHMWGPGNAHERPPVPTGRLAQVDIWLKTLLDDGFKIIGHTLVWHGQSPNWLNLSAGRRDRAEGRVYRTYNEARENMRLFINTIAGHWYNHPEGLYIHAWDVINEAVSRNNSHPISPEAWGYHTRGAIWVPQGEQWHSPWYMAYDNRTPANANPWDYVYDSFVFARRADPSAILIYNDYNMEVRDKVHMVVNMVNAVNLLWARDTANNSQGSRNYTSVPQYIDAGGRLLIEGIGLQQHDTLKFTNMHFDNVEYAIQQYINTGARVSITELDVGVPGYERGGKLSEVDELNQALHFAKLFMIFKKYHEHIDRVSFWGIDDNRNWRPAELCHIFDGNYKAKLAYYAVADPEGFLEQHSR